MNNPTCVTCRHHRLLQTTPAGHGCVKPDLLVQSNIMGLIDGVTLPPRSISAFWMRDNGQFCGTDGAHWEAKCAGS